MCPTMSDVLVAWDPGLDCSGYAAYSRRCLGTGVTIEERAGPALILAGSLSTQPGTELGERIDRLCRRARGLSLALPPDQLWVIEQPAKKAVYARHRAAGSVAMHQSLMLCSMVVGALGAVASQVTGRPPVYVRAARVRKEIKQALGARILASSSSLAQRSNADTRDAIYVGACALLNGWGRTGTG